MTHRAVYSFLRLRQVDGASLPSATSAQGRSSESPRPSARALIDSSRAMIDQTYARDIGGSRPDTISAVGLNIEILAEFNISISGMRSGIEFKPLPARRVPQKTRGSVKRFTHLARFRPLKSGMALSIWCQEGKRWHSNQIASHLGSRWFLRWR